MSENDNGSFSGGRTRRAVLATIKELNIQMENKPLEEVLGEIKSSEDNTANENAIIQDLNKKKLETILVKEGYILDNNIIKRR